MESRIIRTTLQEALSAPLTKEQKEQLARLKNIRDEDIDFSDIPELTDEQLARATCPGRGGARLGAGRKPNGNRSVHQENDH